MARVFIVDDEAEIVSLLGFVLQADGHEAESAGDGETALAKLRAGDRLPDLLLLDVHMPKLGGLETAKALAADPRLRAVPIVVLSARGQANDEFRACPNVAGFLQKPFMPKDLMAALDRVLAARGADGAR